MLKIGNQDLNLASLVSIAKDQPLGYVSGSVLATHATLLSYPEAYGAPGERCAIAILKLMAHP